MEKWKLTKLDPTLQTRTFKASWTYDLETYDVSWDKPEPKVDISTLTVDEQADLIVEKLKAPPKPKRSLQDDYADIMAKMIADEIDAEILRKINTPKGQK